MTYTYDFDFFKSGKKFFTKKELEKLIKTLEDFGFEVKPGNLTSQPYKNGKFEFQEKEKSLMINILYDPNPGFTFPLFLEIPDKKEDYCIARLSAGDWQIEYKNEERNGQYVEFSSEEITSNCQVFYKAAAAVMWALKPYFAWGDHELLLNGKEITSFDKITALAWINMFSLEFVEKLGGLDKVLLFPNPEVEKAYKDAKKTGEYMFVPLQLAENPRREGLNDIEDTKVKEKFPDVIFDRKDDDKTDKLVPTALEHYEKATELEQEANEFAHDNYKLLDAAGKYFAAMDEYKTSLKLSPGSDWLQMSIDRSQRNGKEEVKKEIFLGKDEAFKKTITNEDVDKFVNFAQTFYKTPGWQKVIQKVSRPQNNNEEDKS